jgi:hypothetical protein
MNCGRFNDDDDDGGGDDDDDGDDDEISIILSIIMQRSLRLLILFKISSTLNQFGYKK